MLKNISDSKNLTTLKVKNLNHKIRELNLKNLLKTIQETQQALVLKQIHLDRTLPTVHLLKQK